MWFCIFFITHRALGDSSEMPIIPDTLPDCLTKSDSDEEAQDVSASLGMSTPISYSSVFRLIGMIFISLLISMLGMSSQSKSGNESKYLKNTG